MLLKKNRPLGVGQATLEFICTVSPCSGENTVSLSEREATFQWLTLEWSIIPQDVK